MFKESMVNHRLERYLDFDPFFGNAKLLCDWIYYIYIEFRKKNDAKAQARENVLFGPAV